MKKIILLIFAIALFSSCERNDVKPFEPIKQDTVVVERLVLNDTLINELRSEIVVLRDSIDILNTTTTYENYINGRRIEKIKYYITITERRPDNKKYFFGWIKRTMSE